MNVEEITASDLKDIIDRGEKIKLIMTFHAWAYEAKHIPGSLRATTMEEGQALGLAPSDEIVLYCVNRSCQASVHAYVMLYQAGFKNIRRFAGGLQAWEEAGYPLEGSDINKVVEPDDHVFEA